MVKVVLGGFRDSEEAIRTGIQIEEAHRGVAMEAGKNTVTLIYPDDEHGKMLASGITNIAPSYGLNVLEPTSHEGEGKVAP